jgi:mycarose O-acyltransferase
MVELSSKESTLHRVGGESGPRLSRLPSLTGMRFIAAGMVFFFHSFYENLFNAPSANNAMAAIFSEGGWAGVSFFFVLSGFVLTWSARPSDTAKAFWRRRFFKIYPNHLFTFIVAAILLTTVSAQAFDGGDALLNIFLLQAWVPKILVSSSFNGVSWSLSCEALFYLCFPLLISLIRRIRPERLWLWAGIVIVAILLVPTASLLVPGTPVLPVMNLSDPRFWFIYVCPAIRLLDFVFGILMARIVMTGQRVPLGLGGAGALAIGAYAVTPLLPWSYTLVASMVIPLGLVIAAGAVADVEGRRSWLSSRVMVWLGEISFAFYMWHRIVLLYGHQLLGKSWNTPVAVLVLLFLFGMTILLAWGTYRLLEQPMMKRFSKARRTIGKPVLTVQGGRSDA